jgi:hypothetical protein
MRMVRRMAVVSTDSVTRIGITIAFWHLRDTTEIPVS